MTPELWLRRSSLVLAIIGPVAGAAALMWGEIALWQGPAARPLPPAADAGLYLGTWATLACLGLMAASPFRLAVAAGLATHARWRWAAVCLAAVVGCLDLSAGPILAWLSTIVWRRAPDDQRQSQI